MTELKSAEEWAGNIESGFNTLRFALGTKKTVADVVRAIQADALRWAGEEARSLKMAPVEWVRHIEAKAEELEGKKPS